MDGANGAAEGLRGFYHDVVRGDRGRIVWDSGRRSNTIVAGCKRMLATVMSGTVADGDFEVIYPGIQGLRVGAGNPDWDRQPAPAVDAGQQTLFDPNSYLLPREAMTIDFLNDDGSVATRPTNRLRIVARLGPRQPDWPEASGGPHKTGTLREFALIGKWKKKAPPAGPPSDNPPPDNQAAGGQVTDGAAAAAEEEVLLNYVIHPALTKDPNSTLERTLFLVF